MKRLLKLLLSLGILIAGIYAATPLWLPYIFAKQLPPGWQLEKLDAAYPGFSGININVLRVKGEFQAAGVALAVADIRFSFRGLKTEIGSLLLDVFMQAAADSRNDAITLDDLSLPVTKLTGKLPELSVSKLQVTLHHAVNIEPGKAAATQPLVLDFQAFKLLPRADNTFQLTTNVNVAGSPDVMGQLDVDVSKNSLKAKIRFPAAAGSPPWLVVSLEQHNQTRKTTTQIKAAFDAEPANRQWLDAIVARGTGGLLTHVSGKLAVQADFAGKDIQRIEYLSLAAGPLHAELADGMLVLDAELLASRKGKIITVALAKPAEIRYREKDVKINAGSISAEISSHNGRLFSTGGGTLMDVQSASLAISAAKVDVAWDELDLLKLAGKLSTKTQGFATEIDGETLSGFDFDVAFTLLSNADVNGSGTLKFDAGPDLPIEFAGNTQAERWEITLPATTIELAQLGSLLRVVQFRLPASVELTNGAIDLQGEVVVADEIKATMAISGYAIGASMLESSIRKASFTFNTIYGGTDHENTVTADGSLSIEAATLAGGVDVENIRADLYFENAAAFGLNNLSAEVFNGQLKLASLRFSEYGLEETTVEGTGINLGRLLAFADIEGLEGTGKLNISLPAGSDQTGLYIKNGTFNSTGPGRLAYTKEGVVASNIGLQALENFQYQDFSGTITYQSDGAYQIAIHLEGNNPDLYGGKAIVFNLNINGTLPELFEALFITGSFEESILKQIRAN